MGGDFVSRVVLASSWLSPTPTAFSMVCETGVLRPWACAHALFTFSLAGEQVSAWVTNPGIAAYAPFSHRLEAGSFGYGFASVHRPPRELGKAGRLAAGIAQLT